MKEEIDANIIVKVSGSERTSNRKSRTKSTKSRKPSSTLFSSRTRPKPRSSTRKSTRSDPHTSFKDSFKRIEARFKGKEKKDKGKWFKFRKVPRHRPQRRRYAHVLSGDDAVNFKYFEMYRRVQKELDYKKHKRMEAAKLRKRRVVKTSFTPFSAWLLLQNTRSGLRGGVLNQSFAERQRAYENYMKVAGSQSRIGSYEKKQPRFTEYLREETRYNKNGHTRCNRHWARFLEKEIRRLENPGMESSSMRKGKLIHRRPKCELTKMNKEVGMLWHRFKRLRSEKMRHRIPSTRSSSLSSSSHKSKRSSPRIVEEIDLLDILRRKGHKITSSLKEEIIKSRPKKSKSSSSSMVPIRRSSSSVRILNKPKRRCVMED